MGVGEVGSEEGGETGEVEEGLGFVGAVGRSEYIGFLPGSWTAVS